MRRTALSMSFVVMTSAMAFGLSGVSAHAAQRVPVVEMFTSTTCPPCVEGNRVITADVRNAHPNAVLVRYHVWWPSPGNDPYYLENPSDSRDRVSFYGVSGVPDVYVDGVNIDYSSAGGRVASEARLTTPLGMSITATDDQATITVTPETGLPTADYTLQVCIAEDSLWYTGPNGDPLHHEVVRDVLPDGGMTIHLTSTMSTTTYNVPLSFGELWVREHTHVVAFIQATTASHPIIQGCKCNAPPAMYTFAATATRPAAASGRLGTSMTAGFWIHNTGIADDYYMVSVAESTSLHWSAAVSVAGHTISPTDAQLIHASDSLWIDVAATSGSAAGTAQFYASISSRNLHVPHSVVLTFYAGQKALLVDDDDGASFETYWQRNLRDLSVTQATWSKTLYGMPSLADLQDYNTVIWFTGAAGDDAIDPQEEALLATYLSTVPGARLLMSSEDGANYMQNRASTFLANYIHVSVASDDAISDTLRGALSDPLFAAFNYHLGGATNANDNTTPDVLTPLDGTARPIFYYGAAMSEVAGVLTTGSAYRMVWLGYNLEGVGGNVPARDALLRAILTSLGTITGIDESPVTVRTAVPGEWALGTNVPNPFNPRTTIPLDIRDGRTSQTTVIVYNLLGRPVRTLINGMLGQGHRTLIWDGSDDNGRQVPSGVYMAIMQRDGRSETTRMALMR